MKTSFIHDNINIIFETSYPNDHIFKIIKNNLNFYELRLLRKIQSLNLSGTYIDIGANIGNHSVYFDKFTKSDKVYSIEAHPSIYNILTSNLQHNNCDKTIPINTGIGNRDKMVSMTPINENNVGMTRCIDGTGGNIHIKRLDSIISDTDISLIKIDTEGYELNVVEGAVDILSNQSPIVFAELATPFEFDEFYKFMDKFGYNTDKVNYAATPTYMFYKK